MMIELSSRRWADFCDAYGPATELAERLAQNPEGTLSESDPHELWSKLCHQGDIYSASYAVVPHLLIAQLAAARPSRNVIALIAAIHMAHIEGRGPRVPDEVLEAYIEAIESVPRGLARFLVPGLNEESCRAILAACAACSGNVLTADVLLESRLSLLDDFS